MPLILGTNSIKDTGYTVANSVRYNDDDSPKLNINFGSDGVLNKWTFSMWFKRSTLGTAQRLFCVIDGGMDDYIKFDTADQLEWTFDHEDSNRGILKTNRKFRDVSAWYHLVCRLDTTDSTAGDRMRMYINGTEETSFATDTNPPENETGDIGRDNNHYIGTSGSSQYFDGYIAEVCMINNQSLAPTSFGEFDSDTPSVFKPIDVSGLTAGTNGFYLDFEDSSNLGNNAFGGTDWTETNLSATDSAIDVPTNNFATLNPLVLIGNTGRTYTEGNLSFAASSSNWTSTYSTIAASQGKWYAEMKIETLSSSNGYGNVGIIDIEHDTDANFIAGAKSAGLELDYRGGSNVNAFSAGSNLQDAGVNFAEDVIVGLAVDMDNNALYISENGTYITISSVVGVPTSGASKTGAITIPSTFNFFAFAIGGYTADFKGSWNFGSPSYANSSDAADADGYGAFEYAPPSGYYALNTKNLAEYG